MTQAQRRAAAKRLRDAKAESEGPFVENEGTQPAPSPRERPGGRARTYLLSLKNSGKINGTACAVIDRLLSYPESDYGPADLNLLTGTQRTIGEKWGRLTSSILRKWNEQQCFIQFIDGNVMDFRPSNLRYVTVPDTVITHWEDPSWRVDWDLELDEFEAQLVMNPEWREGLTFRPR